MSGKDRPPGQVPRWVWCDARLLGAERHVLGVSPWTLDRTDGRASWAFCSRACAERFLGAIGPEPRGRVTAAA